MPRILRFALMVLMAIASAVFIYGMVQEFNRLPPQSAPTNQGNAQPHAITSALSYDRKFIHPECREENGVRHCEVPSEEATPTTPIKPHEQITPQAPQINSDVPDYPKRYTNDVRKLQFPKDLQFHYDNRSVTINFGPYHLRILKSALPRAVEQQALARNPADALKRLPKVERKPQATLAVEQSQRLLAAIRHTTP